VDRLRRRLELTDSAALAAQREHLGRGSVMLAGVDDVAVGEDCELELVNPAGSVLAVAAMAVWVGPTGTAFAFHDTSAAALAIVEQWATETSEAAEAAEAAATAATAETADPAPAVARRASGLPGGREPLNARERLRGISHVEQQRVAREGEASERIVLERMYGKAVWEPLLRNLRLTQPEVAHIARMGAIPKPLIELIVGNPGWLQWAQVRRALLGNPRLPGELAERVLRVTPKNELKMIVAQPIYPATIRAAAKRMLSG
jgi:hypothetical protein